MMLIKQFAYSFIIGLISGSVLAGITAIIGWFAFRKYWDNPKLIFGYHIHHSVLGLLLIILGFYFSLVQKSEKAPFLIGFGIGMIIVHTIEGGKFVFIEKINGKSN